MQSNLGQSSIVETVSFWQRLLDSLPLSVNQDGTLNSAVLNVIRSILFHARNGDDLFGLVSKMLNASARQDTFSAGSEQAICSLLADELRREWAVESKELPLDAGIDGLLNEIRGDEVLSKIETLARQSLQGDPAHDMRHVLRVAVWALKIAPEDVPRNHILAAAMLHDVVNLPKNHKQARSASKMSSDRSREFLSEISFSSAEDIDRICQAIEEHSYSRGLKPSSELGKVLQDADRLDALGVTGIIRTFAVGIQLGTDPFNIQDPWAKKRVLDDMKYTVDHFYTKLLRLSLTMCTEAGRAEAELRTSTMEHFLELLRADISR